jgi:response regulator of citrate/malate metabolism
VNEVSGVWQPKAKRLLIVGTEDQTLDQLKGQLVGTADALQTCHPSDFLCSLLEDFKPDLVVMADLVPDETGTELFFCVYEYAHKHDVAFVVHYRKSETSETSKS